MATPTSCSWQLTLPHVALICAAHEESALPWYPVPGCALPVAQVCCVCVRTAVPIDACSAWSFLCRRCSALDAALAQPFDAHAMTPHRSRSGTDRETLFGRLLPERVSRLEVVERGVRANGVAFRIARDVAPEGEGWLAPLLRHRQAVAAGMVAEVVCPAGVAADGGGGGHRVPWAVWENSFPQSEEATARAYQAYVTEIYPWVQLLEPRVADVDWLVGLMRR